MDKFKRVKNIILACLAVIVLVGWASEFYKKDDPDPDLITFYDIQRVSDNKVNEGALRSSDPYSAADPDSHENDLQSVESINGKIDLNTADAEQLMTLKGIGEVKAKAILDYRKAYGNFTCIEEITEVRGIGDATFNNIKDHICVN